MAFSMQTLLVNWLLIGVLLLPAGQVGILQALIGIPGIFLMLWGGASADRTDPRSLLVRVYSMSPLLPLFLLVVDQVNALSVWAVAVWGVAMGVIVSFSAPAQQAILNRVSGAALQRGVSAATGVAFVVQIGGFTLAGQMDQVGLSNVLLIQAACLAVGAVAIRRIGAVPPPEDASQTSRLATIAAGLRATLNNRVVFQILTINLASSIFNAGAFNTVFPFIIKRVYDGDAALLGMMMAVFFAGAAFSNMVMYKLMPFAQPGKLFLIMQLSRILIVLLLWLQPSWWLLVLVIVGWGVNMGFTTTLARTIVQESAEPAFRGRIISVFTLGMMGSAPIGAIVLGFVIETFGTLNALLPAMAVSLSLFLYGVFATRVWDYRSPGAVAAGG
jgi:Na+/melibiose symporter-like transporter